jgi:hypothetical protein
MKILFGDFNAKVGREDIYKPLIGNENLYEIVNDNGVKVVNFATSKNLTVKKKGDKIDCSNYWGISLLSTSYKILSNILRSRLSPYIDEIIRSEERRVGKECRR